MYVDRMSFKRKKYEWMGEGSVDNKLFGVI